MKHVVLLLLIFCIQFIYPNKIDTLRYGIFIDNKKIGYTIITRRENQDTVITSTKNVTQFKRGKAKGSTKVILKTIVYEDKKGTPLSFKSKFKNSTISRVFSGHFRDSGYVTITEQSKSGKKDKKLPWPKNAFLNEGIKLNYEQSSPEIGKTYSYITIDFNAMELNHITKTVLKKEPVKVLSKMESLYAIETVYKNSDDSRGVTIYVTDEWRERKIISQLGALRFVFKELPADVFNTRLSEFDIISKIKIKAPKGMPSPRSYKNFYYLLRLPPDIAIPTSTEQKILYRNDDEMTIKVSKQEIPISPKYPPTNMPKEMHSYLSPSPAIESDDSLIIHLSKKAIRGARKTKTALNRIIRFVRSYLTPSLKFGIATAKETAIHKKGDCSEFAMLTTALCRAGGIPSRIVIGFAYIPYIKDFYYHAWSQAYIDGKWVSIDAAMRNFDPGHIALAYRADGRLLYQDDQTLGRIEVIRGSSNKIKRAATNFK